MMLLSFNLILVMQRRQNVFLDISDLLRRGFQVKKNGSDRKRQTNCVHETFRFHFILAITFLRFHTSQRLRQTINKDCFEEQLYVLHICDNKDLIVLYATIALQTNLVLYKSNISSCRLFKDIFTISFSYQKRFLQAHCDSPGNTPEK